MDLAGLEQVFRIASYAAAPCIAAGAAAIAYQQYKVNHRKLKLDQYDRRMKIYSELKTLLSIIVSQGKATTRELVEFRGKVAEADFLFGSEVMAYLDEVYKHAIDLGMWSDMYRDYTQAPNPPGYDHQKVVASKHKEFLWIADQYGPALEKFRPYLDINR